MEQADPGFTPNCPKCPRPMRYLGSVKGPLGAEQPTHFYQCPKHSVWKLEPKGRFRAGNG